MSKVDLEKGPLELGEPAHFALLRRVEGACDWAMQRSARETLRGDSSRVGVIVWNRLHASWMAYEGLLAELLDMCIEREYSIPSDIDLSRADPIGEGQ